MTVELPVRKIKTPLGNFALKPLLSFSPEEGELAGIVRYDLMEVRIDCQQPPAMVARTILHELLEISVEASKEAPEGDCFVGDLEIPLFVIARDNPTLWAWIGSTARK